jgi:hypothetical protein
MIIDWRGARQTDKEWKETVGKAKDGCNSRGFCKALDEKVGYCSRQKITQKRK